MSPRLHTNFTKIKAHTAKCDFCEMHNKLTLYRCTECGQQTCSVCWNKLSGDKLHLFNGGVAGGPDLNAYSAVNDDEAGDQGDESQARTFTGRRGYVLTNDGGDNAPVSKSTRARVKAEAGDVKKQKGKRHKFIESTDHHEGHEDRSTTLWPMISARGLAVLRPAVPAASTSAYEIVNQETQRNPHLQGQEPRRDQRRMAQAYDGIDRQAVPTRHVFIDGQQTIRHARHQPIANGPHQQTTHPAYLHTQPAVYRSQPVSDVDQQAAYNQYAFANSQSTNRQVSRPAQPHNAQQQGTQVAPPYPPRPGVDVDQQAARNQVAFTRRPDTNHQAHSQDPASNTQLRAQDAAKMAQIAARNQQAFYLNQQAQQYSNAEQMEARKIPHQNGRPVFNGDQVVARNQQVPNLNRLPPASGNHMVEMLVARDPQDAYFSREQADYPSPPNSGIAQSWASHMNPFPLPAQAFPSAQHTAPPASRQFRHRVAIEDLLNGPSEDVQDRKVCLVAPVSWKRNTNISPSAPLKVSKQPMFLSPIPKSSKYLDVVPNRTIMPTMSRNYSTQLVNRAKQILPVLSPARLLRSLLLKAKRLEPNLLARTVLP